MDLELFTVLYKQNGVIGIEFNEQLLQAATEEEIFKEMTNEMEAIKPIVSKLMIFLQKGTEPKVPETCYEAYGKDCIDTIKDLQETQNTIKIVKVEPKPFKVNWD